MNKHQIGFLLIFGPIILLFIIMFLFDYIDTWKRAIFRYKQLNDKFEIVCVIVSTIILIMFFAGAYLFLNE